MMLKAGYYLKGPKLGCHDAVYVSGDEDPLEALVESVVQSISTDIIVRVGDVEMHLAAWQDPDHWSEDWHEKGIEPGEVAALVTAALVEA